MLNFFRTWSLKFFHLNLRYFGTMHAPKKKMTGNLYLCGKTRMENGLYLEWSINMENIFPAMDPATKGRDIKHSAFS